MKNNQGEEIQLLYAKILDRGARLGFTLLVLAFCLYISGLLDPYVSLDRLPQYWSQPLEHYLEAAQIPLGWSWLGDLHHADFLNFLAVALLAGVAILGYFLLIPRFFRNQEPVMGIIAILEVIILSIAASGILLVKGH